MEKKCFYLFLVLKIKLVKDGSVKASIYCYGWDVADFRVGVILFGSWEKWINNSGLIVWWKMNHLFFLPINFVFISLTGSLEMWNLGVKSHLSLTVWSGFLVLWLFLTDTCYLLWVSPWLESLRFLLVYYLLN